MYRTSMPQFETAMVRDYLKGLRGESNGYFTRAYGGGVWDWQPDSEPESDGERVSRSPRFCKCVQVLRINVKRNLSRKHASHFDLIVLAVNLDILHL
jgi:hypothetical protein